MTALRFQTGGRHQTSPASLRAERENVCVCVSECVCERDRKRECVRERECVCERVYVCVCVHWIIHFHVRLGTVYIPYFLADHYDTKSPVLSDHFQWLSSTFPIKPQLFISSPTSLCVYQYKNTPSLNVTNSWMAKGPLAPIVEKGVEFIAHFIRVCLLLCPSR